MSRQRIEIILAEPREESHRHRIDFCPSCATKVSALAGSGAQRERYAEIVETVSDEMAGLKCWSRMISCT